MSDYQWGPSAKPHLFVECSYLNSSHFWFFFVCYYGVKSNTVFLINNTRVFKRFSAVFAQWNIRKFVSFYCDRRRHCHESRQLKYSTKKIQAYKFLGRSLIKITNVKSYSIHECHTEIKTLCYAIKGDWLCLKNDCIFISCLFIKMNSYGPGVIKCLPTNLFNFMFKTSSEPKY